MIVTDLIDRGARQFGDRPAILFDGKSLTFAEVDRTSTQIARRLVETHGLAPGAPIGLLMGNGLLSVSMDFACMKARLMRVPLNSRLSAVEHARMLSGIGAAVLVHGAAHADRARELAEAVPGLSTLEIESGIAADLDAVSDTPLPAAQPDDPVLALYTSGTSGVLKAAVHTQATYSAVAANILLNLVDPRPGDIMLHAASLIHASGTFVLPYWMRGGASAVLGGFEPGAYLKAIEQVRPTALNLVPTMIGMLLEHPDCARTDFSPVRDIIYGASPMPRPMILKALDRWGPRLSQFYGQTEAPLCIAVLGKEDHVGEGAERRLSACGRPALDCEIKLVGEDGTEAAPGSEGEILVRAPFLMTGYHGAPELNAETFAGEGWLRTRDIGRTDEAGFLHLVDRASDMIVTGGYNVYPREVEDVLAAHPCILEVVVVGLPDDKWGEAVAAFVVTRGEIAFDEAHVLAYAREHLASYKAPKSIHCVETLPKSAVGKPLRRAVREPFWAGRERRI